MAKYQNKLRKAERAEGDTINQQSDDLMKLLYGQLGQTGQSGKNPLFNDVMSGYKDLGGMSFGGGVSNRPDFGRYESQFGDIFKTGGVDEENKKRIRGGGVFDEYAKTGGYSDADKSNIRARGARTVPAFYDALRSKMSQQAAISGGGPSYNSSLQRMARDQSRGVNEAQSDTEFNIMDRVNEGRRWGSSSMSSAEQGLAELISRNKLGASEGGLRAAMGGGDFDLRNRGLDLQGQGLGLQAKLGSLGGMSNMYGNSQDEISDLLRIILGAQGQRGSLMNSNFNTRNNTKGSSGQVADFLTQFMNNLGTAYGSGR